MNYATFFAGVIEEGKLNGEASAVAMMEKLAAAGIIGTDMHSENLSMYGVAPIKKLHDDVGMRVTCVFHIEHADYKNSAVVKEIIGKSEKSIEDCASVGSKVLMAVPLICVPHTCAQDREDTLKGVTEYVNGLSEISEKYGVTTAVENYSLTETALSYISDIEYVLNNATKVRYVFDSGNFWFGGDDTIEACKKFADKTVHVHLNDLIESKDGEFKICGKEAADVAIGDGILPNYEAIEILRNAGYKGPYTIESTYSPGLKKVFRSLENLKANIK